jgi:cysteine desulfurase
MGRTDFMKKIYLDNNATTPVLPEVYRAMKPYFGKTFGNPSSVHSFGQDARKIVENARETVAKFLKASHPEEIIFTSCGTESNNNSIKGVAFANQNKGKHIITSKIEHHAVLGPCEYLARHFGYEITRVGTDKSGIIDPDDVKKAITPKTVLISIMTANNETGNIQPVMEIGRIAQEHDVCFHTDAVQAAGKMPIDVNEIQADLLSISGHKMYAPKGIGVLYIRKGTKIHQLMHGGSHEFGKRAGTENVPYIAGLARACEIAMNNMAQENERISKLRNKLEKGLLERVQYAFVNGDPDNRLSNTTNISFEFVEGEGLLLSLDLAGVAVSTGSACTSGTTEPSHVLSAMGITPLRAQSSVRFSLGHFNNDEDIDKLLEILPRTVERLRSISPLWNGAGAK